MAAPLRGYTCAPCPPPFVGDGVVCSRPPPTIPCPHTVRCYPGATCREEVNGEVACAACPPGMEGDGVLCRPRCFPACNAHQKCSVPECTAEAKAVEQEGQQQVVVAVAYGDDDVDEEVAALAVRALDLSYTSALCDKPCRWVTKGPTEAWWLEAVLQSQSP